MSYTADTAEKSPLTCIMKGIFFRFLTKRSCLLGVLVAFVLGASFTLTSCGGGEGDEVGYIVTPQQFASGSKSFYILANNLWTIRATDSNNLILSAPDKYTNTAAAWGEITTGSYDKDNAGHAICYFHYQYNPEDKTGVLEWSWDSADPNNSPTAALAFITTIHNLKGNGANEEGNGNKEEEMGGIGEEDDPTALAEHYRQLRLELNFNTGMCVLYCGCGAYSQNLHFDVRAGN